MSYDPKSWLRQDVPERPTRRPKKRVKRVPAVTLLITVAVAGLAVASGMLLHRELPIAPAVSRHEAARAPVRHMTTAPVGRLRSRRILPVGPESDVAALLTQVGVVQKDSISFSAAVRNHLVAGATVLMLDLISDPDGKAQHVHHAALTRPDGSGVVFVPTSAGFSVNPIRASLTTATHVLHGQMDGETFYTSAVAAGIDDRLIPQITAALAFDFDFAREIHRGDVFEVAYRDRVNVQGQDVGAKDLLYVSLVTASKQVALYRFHSPGAAEPGWFTGEGRSARRSLMRTPVEGARVSSGFGMRFHPVLGYTRMHKGIDFAVPVGTPVFASGDGVVAAMGSRSGFGLYLRIDHTPQLATAYGHLSRYPANISLGSHVHQGEVVAYSGMTGIATGPHLHYEILVQGQQVNPVTFSVAEGFTLGGAALTAFRNHRDRIDRLRQNAM